MLDKPTQTFVLGLPLHLLPNYVPWLADCVRSGQPAHVVTLNSEMAMQAQQNPDLTQVIHRAELVVPDGAGVVLYLALRGLRIQRQPGIEIAEDLLQEAAKAEWTVFFYGGAPGVAEQAAQNWQQRLPGLRVIGVENGYLDSAQETTFIQTLQQLKPQIILVGLGVPRQEFWIHKHRNCCPQAVWIGVGGSFDIWAGVKTRAPRWLRDHHLEWVYRLYQEPWRWRRMMALPRFALRALLGA